MGVHVAHCTETRRADTNVTDISLSISITDRMMFEILAELKEGTGIEMEDDITAVERPTTHSITVPGTSNLTVKWDKEQGLFRLESVCVVCGRRFERTLRSFVTKELVVLVHELGFKLGEHLERHQSFSTYLGKLKQGSEKGD